MSILIKNIEEIYTVEKNHKIIENGYIIIKNGIIKKVGFMKDFDNKNVNNFEKIIDAKNQIAIPGLINTHTHAAMTLLRGYADDLPLQTWLEDKIWPFEGRLRKKDFYWGSKLAVIEMLKTGTTTFSDMYFNMEETAKVVKETGIRAVLSEGLIEENDGEKGLKKSIDFAQKWNNNTNNRITTMLAPHSPYTCSSDYLIKIAKNAKKLNIPLHIHLAETENEVNIIKEKYNTTPTKYLDNLGIFSETNVLAAHCIYLNDEEINILAKKNVGVAHNPLSNMKLGSGIASISEMLNRDILVSLATDGVSSNNNLNLFEEAKIAAYLQKVINKDPSLIDIYDLLEMLTINGAKALNIDNLGRIKNGYLADILLININDSSYFYPHHNNLSNLFYSANSPKIDTVIVNGKVLMKDNKLLNIDSNKVFYEIEKRALELS
ncbi:MAG: amidohydrolase [archaeon]